MKTIFSKTILGVLAASFLMLSCKKKEEDTQPLPVEYPPHTISGCSGSLLNISENTTWEDVYSDPALVDYVIGCRINVIDGAVLTIAPGVRIQFSTATSSITTISNGGIVANGTSTQPILLQGTNAVKGHWSGIHIAAQNSSTSFQYVTIRDAGAGVSSSGAEEAGLYLNTAPSGTNLIGTVTNCRFENNKGTGFMSNYGVIVTNFGFNTFVNNEHSPMRIDAFAMNMLNDNNTYSGNGNDFIDIYKGHPANGYTSSILVKKMSLPYRLANGEKLNIKDGDLTIEAGTIFQMSAGTEVAAENFAGMSARIFINGTASEPVVFIGTENQVGFWKGIKIATSGTSTITYCDVIRAGSTNVTEPGETISAAIFVSKFYSGNAQLTNCSISESGGHGIAYGSTGSTVVLTNNQFSGITGSDIFTY